MKLLISFALLLFVVTAEARVVILSYPGTQKEEALNVLRLMQDVHHIPADFIEVVESLEPCRRMSAVSSWHVCINDNGDLHEVAVDISFIRETLRVFL
jgi:hypothetical protein